MLLLGIPFILPHQIKKPKQSPELSWKAINLSLYMWTIKDLSTALWKHNHKALPLKPSVISGSTVRIFSSPIRRNYCIFVLYVFL